jgi:hypothetical protein
LSIGGGPFFEATKNPPRKAGRVEVGGLNFRRASADPNLVGIIIAAKSERAVHYGAI